LLKRQPSDAHGVTTGPKVLSMITIQRKEYQSLMRKLAPEEILFLRTIGQRGEITVDLRRLFLSLLVEGGACNGCDDLPPEQVELLGFYLHYPEELERVLSRLAPRTPPYNVLAALSENFLLRNDGRMPSRVCYTGPRRIKQETLRGDLQ
jgi:hypothetical protein